MDLSITVYRESPGIENNGFNEIHYVTHLQRITLPERQMHGVSPSERVSRYTYVNIVYIILYTPVSFLNPPVRIIRGEINEMELNVTLVNGQISSLGDRY